MLADRQTHKQARSCHLQDVDLLHVIIMRVTTLFRCRFVPFSSQTLATPQCSLAPRIPKVTPPSKNPISANDLSAPRNNHTHDVRKLDERPSCYCYWQWKCHCGVQSRGRSNFFMAVLTWGSFGRGASWPVTARVIPASIAVLNAKEFDSVLWQSFVVQCWLQQARLTPQIRDQWKHRSVSLMMAASSLCRGL